MGYLESIACQTRSFSSIYCNLHLYYLDWNDHTTVTARVACIMRWSVSAMHIDWRLRECSSERSCLQPMLQQVVLNYNANVKFIAPPTHGPSGTLPFPGSFFFFFARAKKKYSEHVPWPVKGASLPHLQKYTSRNTHCTLQYPWKPLEFSECWNFKLSSRVHLLSSNPNVVSLQQQQIDLTHCSNSYGGDCMYW